MKLKAMKLNAKTVTRNNNQGISRTNHFQKLLTVGKIEIYINNIF